jgi:two-component system phosphate regulon response regulator PhoB
MTPRVMIVEDEEPLSLMLRYNLEAEGYQVDTVERGDDAETRLRENIPDLLLLDWMLPGVSGIELCRRLRTREQTRSLPIIMLTARGEEQERVRGLATGADDYVVKPFSVPELMARVRAILRRSRPELIASVLRAGEIELDRETHRVRRKSRELHLGPTEFRLLEFFMQAPRVLARPASRRRLGPRRLCRRAHRRRPCRPPAEGPWPGPRPDPHRPRLRLLPRRGVHRGGVNPEHRHRYP